MFRLPTEGRFAKSEEVKAIEDFLTSGNAKNMCFEYDAYRVDKCIYIIRGAKVK